MNASDLRQKNVNELTVLLDEKRDALRKLRFKVSERQLKSVRDIRKIRREIAQISTVLKEMKEQRQSA